MLSVLGRGAEARHGDMVGGLKKSWEKLGVSWCFSMTNGVGNQFPGGKLREFLVLSSWIFMVYDLMKSNVIVKSMAMIPNIALI